MFRNRMKIEMWASCGDDFFYGLEGEKKDYSLAADFYERAAKKKHSYAAYMLGLCYELGGRDLRKDVRKAEEWYQKAAKLGNEEAQKRLATSEIFIPPPPKDEDEDEETVDSKNNLSDGDNLTNREQELLTLLLTGAAPKEIAYNLKISYPTVNFHTKNLYRKLGIQSRAELFAKLKK